MPTIPERLTALERDQLAQEKSNKQALEAHAEQNAMALEAVHIRINEVEQKMGAFATGIGEVNSKLDALLTAKTEEDAVKGMKKDRKFEARDWMFLFVAIVSAAGTIGALLK